MTLVVRRFVGETRQVRADDVRLRPVLVDHARGVHEKERRLTGRDCMPPERRKLGIILLGGLNQQVRVAGQGEPQERAELTETREAKQ